MAVLSLKMRLVVTDFNSLIIESTVFGKKKIPKWDGLLGWEIKKRAAGDLEDLGIFLNRNS